ncbi:MAG: SDR family oxidoreductase [Pseudomonadota bacterium]
MTRTVVITGTRKGIGRYLSERYLAAGWTVYGCSRDESDLAHERYRHFAIDVADERGVAGMLRAVRREARTLDALINNAGIASMNAAVLTPMATVERIFRTNVFGTFLLCREAAKLMIPKRAGRIVNFATVATPLRLEGEAVYAASKAAVENFTQVFARELGGYNITVNAIGPTPVDTDLIRGVADDKMERLIARQCLPRMGKMEDVGNAVDFFLKPESDFVTGQVVYLGGVF